MTTYYQAVVSLVGSENVKGGQTHGPIENITLLDDVEPPSEEAIQTKLAEIIDDYDSKQYQRDRIYPPITDQLDQIYWDKINGTETWKETIDEVKQAHPKPK